MFRRLHPDQPESFSFTPDNLTWAQAQITKYPEGRQASAIIPLLWRAQEQEGWLSRPAIEVVADMLGMAYIRALEVASFYFMFQLQPVGRIAHIQVCGTTSCMICGAEDLIAVCKSKIAPAPHEISSDGNFSWEEVECLGACANAPMAQIGKDYFEDLTSERFADIIDELAQGNLPMPGPQNGRYSAEPHSGLTSLTADTTADANGNASVALAQTIGDMIKRIDGGEVPLRTPWGSAGAGVQPPVANPPPQPKPAHAQKKQTSKQAMQDTAQFSVPTLLDAPRMGRGDDLTRLKGVGPKLAQLLNAAGVFHFDQIAAWSADQVAWADQAFAGFKGRASRDDWTGQARTLMDGS